MQNIFTAEKIIKFKQLAESSCRISIITHTNPDGDAIGSASALKLFLLKCFPEKNIRVFVPNAYPDFLNWLASKSAIEICTENHYEKKSFIKDSDLVILSDLNDLKRTEHLKSTILKSSCPKILIDHHENSINFDLAFHNSRSSSTCFLVLELIKALNKVQYIDSDIATALYCGIMTDTGCFSYSYLTPELFRAAGDLVENGADPVRIYQNVYYTQSEHRIRLLGHLITDKLVLIPHKNAAYITLTKEEKDNYNFSTGDTEGVVNYPLNIKDVSVSALFSETNGYIKVSLRSLGSIDVNLMANKYFNGGGHINASGGKFYGTINEAVESYIKALDSILP